MISSFITAALCFNRDFEMTNHVTSTMSVPLAHMLILMLPYRLGGITNLMAGPVRNEGPVPAPRGLWTPPDAESPLAGVVLCVSGVFGGVAGPCHGAQKHRNYSNTR